MMKNIVRDRSFWMGATGCLLAFGVLQFVASAPWVQAQPDEGADSPARPRGGGGAQSGLQQISHQGVVSVNGQRFTGAGLFRFAIVDPDSGLNRWTNDGSRVGESIMPNGDVSLPVSNGVYSVRLGRAPMSSIPSNIFADSNLVLRIWFNDDSNGWQLLSPDQPLTASTVSLRAVSADLALTIPAQLQYLPPVGSIIAWHKNLSGVPGLPEGWVECNGALTDDPTTAVNESQIPNLNGERRFVRGGGSSGQFEADAFQGHWHNWHYYSDSNMGPSSGSYVVKASPDIGPNQAPRPNYVQNPIADGNGNGAPRTANETRPINMSVVWIMRVK